MSFRDHSIFSRLNDYSALSLSGVIIEADDTFETAGNLEPNTVPQSSQMEQTVDSVETSWPMDLIADNHPDEHITKKEEQDSNDEKVALRPPIILVREVKPKDNNTTRDLIRAFEAETATVAGVSFVTYNKVVARNKVLKEKGRPALFPRPRPRAKQGSAKAKAPNSLVFSGAPAFPLPPGIPTFPPSPAIPVVSALSQISDVLAFPTSPRVLNSKRPASEGSERGLSSKKPRTTLQKFAPLVYTQPLDHVAALAASKSSMEALRAETVSFQSNSLIESEAKVSTLQLKLDTVRTEIRDLEDGRAALVKEQQRALEEAEASSQLRYQERNFIMQLVADLYKYDGASILTFLTDQRATIAELRKAREWLSLTKNGMDIIAPAHRSNLILSRIQLDAVATPLQNAIDVLVQATGHSDSLPSERLGLIPKLEKQYTEGVMELELLEESFADRPNLAAILFKENTTRKCPASFEKDIENSEVQKIITLESHRASPLD